MKKIFILIVAIIVVIAIAYFLFQSEGEIPVEVVEEERITTESFKEILNSVRAAPELVYHREGGYAGFDCSHEEAVAFCEEVEDITGAKPITYSSDVEFCLYGKFYENEYYCIDRDAAYITSEYPGGTDLCDGETFVCPK